MRASSKHKVMTTTIRISREADAALQVLKLVFDLDSKWQAIDLLVAYAKGRLSRRQMAKIRKVLNGDFNFW